MKFDGQGNILFSATGVGGSSISVGADGNMSVKITQPGGVTLGDRVLTSISTREPIGVRNGKRNIPLRSKAAVWLRQTRNTAKSSWRSPRRTSSWGPRFTSTKCASFAATAEK
jgi:hypothetical protein